MTAQEIKDLIASKIAGQGSAVDAGSALPQILNAIVDAIGEGGGGTSGRSILTTGENADFDSFGQDYDTPITKQRLAEILDIPEDEVDNLLSMKYSSILFNWAEEPWLVGISDVTSDLNSPKIILNFFDEIPLMLARAIRVVNGTATSPVDVTGNCYVIKRQGDGYYFYNIWAEYGLTSSEVG